MLDGGPRPDKTNTESEGKITKNKTEQTKLEKHVGGWEKQLSEKTHSLGEMDGRRTEES